MTASKQLTPLSLQRHPLDGPWTCCNLASRLQVSWMWPLLRQGVARPLTAEDIWPSPPGLSAKDVGKHVDELWHALRESSPNLGPDALLRPVLVKLAWWHTVIYVCCSTVCMVLYSLAPMFLRYFLSRLDEDAEISVLALWGASYACCYFMISFLVGVGKWFAQVGGFTCRLAVQHLIYCSCLMMPLDAAFAVTSPMNLMSVDAERFFLLFNATQPHVLMLVVVYPFLLISQVGIVPAVMCMTSIAIATYLQRRVAKRVSAIRRRAMAAADKRLQLTEQFLQGIRIVKMNGWTAFAKMQLEDARKAELRQLHGELFWKGINLMMGLVSPVVVGFCVFVTYAMMDGRMKPEIIFPALTILRGLQLFMGNLPMAFSTFAEFTTSYRRIQAFLTRFAPHALEREAKPCLGDTSIRLQRATFLRASSADSSADDQTASSGGNFKLGPVSLELQNGDLCVVCGPVGSGKSTLLLGLLGELRPSGEDCEVDICGKMALCGQEPWIRSATVHENITCSRPENTAAYQLAVQSCQLSPDLATLPAGDQTEIGSRGINISGGQKARIALARVVFGASDADVVLLDDVLSAVDVHVAQGIINEVLLGALRKKTRILVANTFLPLLLPHADCVMVLNSEGGVDAVGTPRNVLSSSAWLRDVVDSMGGCNFDAVEHTGSVTSIEAQGDMKDGSCIRATLLETGPADAKVAVDGSLLVAEDRVFGVLNAKVYVSYFREATPSRSVAVGVALFTVVIALVLLAEGFRTSTEFVVAFWTRDADWSKKDEARQGNEFWIRIYSFLLLGLIAILLIRVLIFTRAIVAISAQTHSGMLDRILSASVPLFFDVVPVGRILNRFSKDLDSMDSLLPQFMGEFLQAAAYITTIAGICVASSFWTLVVLLPSLLFFAYIRKFYSATSRELKRLQAAALSPVYMHFSETISGLLHIRAFKLVDRMLEEFEEKSDNNVKMFVHQYALMPWLIYRVNMLASSLIASVVIVCIIFRKSINPALVGLSLSAGAGLIGRMHQCVQFSTETENHFTSVERLQHFKSVAQEAESSDSPPPSWPDQGKVEFEGVQLRYRPHLPFVLDRVSFQVAAGKRAGIVGRTGSGKSSCMLALLRMVELAGGRILVDGRDIATVPLQLLRGHAVAIIPQDPFLFQGSVRQNLDPFGKASLAECDKALLDTHLADVFADSGGLSAPVEGNGLNLSVGQRQLLCIARAMLRRARVVLLDEASANIDAKTDGLIQQTIRSSFQKSTLLIIAHRLSTIADADILICMERGKVIEVGQPEDLVHTDGPVAKLFNDAGESLQPLRPAAQAEQAVARPQRISTICSI